MVPLRSEANQVFHLSRGSRTAPGAETQSQKALNSPRQQTEPREVVHSVDSQADADDFVEALELDGEHLKRRQVARNYKKRPRNWPTSAISHVGPRLTMKENIDTMMTVNTPRTTQFRHLETNPVTLAGGGTLGRADLPSW